PAPRPALAPAERARDEPRPGPSPPYTPADPDRTPRPEIPGTNANQPDDENRGSDAVGPSWSRSCITGGSPAHHETPPRAIAMRSARIALDVLGPPAPGPSTAM